MRIIERVFPLVKRYTVILRVGTQKIRYIIHRKTDSINIVENDVIESNLPIVSKKLEIIKEIIQETITEVK